MTKGPAYRRGGECARVPARRRPGSARQDPQPVRPPHLHLEVAVERVAADEVGPGPSLALVEEFQHARHPPHLAEKVIVEVRRGGLQILTPPAAPALPAAPRAIAALPPSAARLARSTLDRRAVLRHFRAEGRGSSGGGRSGSAAAGSTCRGRACRTAARRGTARRERGTGRRPGAAPRPPRPRRRP